MSKRKASKKVAQVKEDALPVEEQAIPTPEPVTVAIPAGLTVGKTQDEIDEDINQALEDQEEPLPVPPKRIIGGGVLTIHAPSGPPPFPLTSCRAVDVFNWCEKVRDFCGQTNKGNTIKVGKNLCPIGHISVRALCQWAMDYYGGAEKPNPGAPVPDAQKAFNLIRDIYNTEFEAEKVADRNIAKEVRAGSGQTGGQKRNVVVNTPDQYITEGKKGGKRYELWGYPITAILRWMGANGWKAKEAKKALAKLGFVDVSDSTINCQLLGGKQYREGKDTRGAPADLNADQAKTLGDARPTEEELKQNGQDMRPAGSQVTPTAMPLG